MCGKNKKIPSTPDDRRIIKKEVKKMSFTLVFISLCINDYLLNTCTQSVKFGYTIFLEF